MTRFSTRLGEEAATAMALPGPDDAARIRRLAGVSRQRVADELGVSRQSVYRSGQRRTEGAP